MLRVVEPSKVASTAKVTHIRVFDPLCAEELALAVRGFETSTHDSDLPSVHGHIETNGSIFITGKEVGQDARRHDALSESYLSEKERSDDVHTV